MIYTGIGSRKTPSPILNIMTEIGMEFASLGHVLRSGGADGADKAFEEGCNFYDGNMEIYLPVQERPSQITESALKLAEEVWLTREVDQPWINLHPYTKLIMARNCLQVLGRDLNTPTDLIICWTTEAKIVGGTGQALALAKMINEDLTDRAIPVLNLANDEDRNTIKDILHTHDPMEIIGIMKGVIHEAKSKRSC